MDVSASLVLLVVSFVAAVAGAWLGPSRVEWRPLGLMGCALLVSLPVLAPALVIGVTYGPLMGRELLSLGPRGLVSELAGADRLVFTTAVAAGLAALQFVPTRWSNTAGRVGVALALGFVGAAVTKAGFLLGLGWWALALPLVVALALALALGLRLPRREAAGCGLLVPLCSLGVLAEFDLFQVYVPWGMPSPTAFFVHPVLRLVLLLVGLLAVVSVVGASRGRAVLALLVAGVAFASATYVVVNDPPGAQSLLGMRVTDQVFFGGPQCRQEVSRDRLGRMRVLTHSRGRTSEATLAVPSVMLHSPSGAETRALLGMLDCAADPQGSIPQLE